MTHEGPAPEAEPACAPMPGRPAAWLDFSPTERLIVEALAAEKRYLSSAQIARAVNSDMGVNRLKNLLTNLAERGVLLSGPKGYALNDGRER